MYISLAIKLHSCPMHDDSSECSDLVKQESDFLKSNLEDYRRKGITALDILRIVMQKNNFFWNVSWRWTPRRATSGQSFMTKIKATNDTLKKIRPLRNIRWIYNISAFLLLLLLVSFLSFFHLKSLWKSSKLVKICLPVFTSLY